MPRPVSNKGSSIVPDGDRLAPIRLTCPPYGQDLQRFCDRSRSADLDNAIDAATIGQLARLLVPIRRLGIINHLGSPQCLESLGLFRGGGCCDRSSAQDSGKLQRKERHAPRTLDQDRVADGHSTVSGQRHPRRSPRRTAGWRPPRRRGGSARHQSFLTQLGVFRQHPVEVGTKPVGQVVGLDRPTKPARMKATGNPVANFDPRNFFAGCRDLARAAGKRCHAKLGRSAAPLLPPGPNMNGLEGVTSLCRVA
jgi:hypothetical protein